MTTTAHTSATHPHRVEMNEEEASIPMSVDESELMDERVDE